MHLYSHRYPAVQGARLNPPDASIQDYRRLQRRLGTGRAVIVTPSTYGTNNQCVLDGLAAMGDSGRGVAVLDPSVPEEHLHDLHAAGIRGVRLNQSLGTTTSIDMLEPLAEKIKGLGWHIQLLMPPEMLVRIGPRLRALDIAVVFDHMGRVDPRTTAGSEAHTTLLNLIESGKAWLKLSGAYILSREGPPDYPDVAALARSYVKAAPDRCIWGSDWPHASATAGMQALPDDAHLLDLLSAWIGDDATFRQVLVENPSTLYQY